MPRNISLDVLSKRMWGTHWLGVRRILWADGLSTWLLYLAKRTYVIGEWR
jgi:hypothetical protein